MSEDESRAGEATAGAEAAFASFLARVRRGDEIDFESYCRERPGLAEPLRRLHDAWSSQRKPPATPGSVPSIRGFLEGGGDTKTGPPEGDETESGVRERLMRLAARTGRYSLRGEVARGGMGVILRVWDRDLRRTLAMKATFTAAPTRAPDQDEMVTRFLEEAQITGQLDHPGIVPVHELGVDEEGRMFFTMRLVKGQTLDQIIRLARKDEEGWTRVRALNVILRVCEAMAYAHTKGVIHRDIKPANIMVGKYGEVYVMDWGLAKVTGRADVHDRQLRPDVSILHSEIRTDRVISDAGTSPVMTMEGTIIGTPTYMPPEQAEGRIDSLDPRSDIYSVGALLYTLLTGWMPYVDPDQPITGGRVLQLLLDGPPKPVLEIDRTVPPELVAICDKAMEREPAKRYPDMGAMAEDLRAFLEQRVVTAYKTGAFAEFRKWVSRNRGIAAAVLALLVLAIGSAGFVAWQEKQKVQQVQAAQEQTEFARSRAVANALEAQANAQRAEANARQAERQSYLANLAAAHASLRVHETREAKMLLRACPTRLRRWEWHHLQRQADTSVRVFRGHADKVTAAAFSPDGTRIASASADRSVRLWDVASGEELFPFAGVTDPVTALAFSPDGARVAAASRDMLVRIWDAQGGRLRGTLAGHESIISSLAFSPDGDRIVTGADEGAVIWDAASMRSLRTVEHEEAVQAVAFSPDGRRFATTTELGVHVWDAETGEARGLFSTDEIAKCVAFDADGSRLALGTHDAVLRVLDASTGETLADMIGHADPVTGVAFAGQNLYSVSFDKTVRVWDAATGASRAVFQGHDEAVFALAVDRSGDRIVSGSGDGTLRLWTMAKSHASLVIPGDDNFLSAAAFAPDGKTLAIAASGDGGILVHDAATGARLAVHELEGGGLSSLCFSRDGRWLIAGSEQDATAWILDAATGAVEHVLRGHEASVTAVAVSPDGTRVATASADQSVRVWDRSGGDLRYRLKDHGTRVATVAYSPDGAVLLTTAGADVRLWDAGSGAPRRTFRAPSPILTAVFDPEGKRIVTAGEDAKIRVWDAATGEPGHVLAGHTGHVVSLAFAADGSRLASGGRDKTVRVWDAATGDGLLRLHAHEGWVTAVAFSPDGKRLASASYDTTARIWLGPE